VLETNNPEWKLPERRVRKFLNRELKKQGHPVPESCPEDDEDSVIDLSPSSRARELANSTGRVLKRVIPFSFRKKKQEKQASAAKEQSMAPTEPFLPAPEETPAEVVEPETPPEPDPVAIKVDDDDDKDVNLFVDDNDGKKEAMVCAQCTIL
jgi:hypothetical protein